MKFYTFKRETNNFADIVTDLKKHIEFKLSWKDHLMIGLSDDFDEKSVSYILIKYGDDLTKAVERDFTPVRGIDYIPRKRRIAHDPEQIF